MSGFAGLCPGRLRARVPQSRSAIRAGENTVTVLELERLGATLELRDRPELGPPEEYVEEFG